MSTIGTQSRPPIRIGVIGATPARGWGTAAHLPALEALEEFEVTAVSTTRLSTARATAEVFGVPLAFADDDELVSCPQVDAVAITVKVPEHDRLIRAALAAGKHVFSEWPLGVDLGQAIALAELAQASGVRHLVGLQGYQAPGALFVRELIENGDLGRLLTVSVVAAGGRPDAGSRRPTSTRPMWPPGPPCSASRPATSWLPWPGRSGSSASCRPSWPWSTPRPRSSRPGRPCR